jgi:hypothetical protein
MKETPTWMLRQRLLAMPDEPRFLSDDEVRKLRLAHPQLFEKAIDINPANLRVIWSPEPLDEKQAQELVREEGIGHA